MTEETTATPTTTKRLPMGFKAKFLLIVVSLLLMGILRTGYLFILLALMPSIIAYYTDVGVGRSLFKTIFACNLTALLPYLMRLMAHGPSNGTLQTIMNSPHTWITLIGASLMGLLLVKVCPIVVQFAVEGVTQTQINHLEQVLKKIENEWGPEVKQLSIQHELEEEKDY